MRMSPAPLACAVLYAWTAVRLPSGHTRLKPEAFGGLSPVDSGQKREMDGEKEGRKRRPRGLLEIPRKTGRGDDRVGWGGEREGW